MIWRPGHWRRRKTRTRPAHSTPSRWTIPSRRKCRTGLPLHGDVCPVGLLHGGHAVETIHSFHGDTSLNKDVSMVPWETRTSYMIQKHYQSDSSKLIIVWNLYVHKQRNVHIMHIPLFIYLFPLLYLFSSATLLFHSL